MLWKLQSLQSVYTLTLFVVGHILSTKVSPYFTGVKPGIQD